MVSTLASEPAASGSIPSIPKLFSEEKIMDAAELIHSAG